MASTTDDGSGYGVATRRAGLKPFPAQGQTQEKPLPTLMLAPAKTGQLSTDLTL
jgi:hypothetical protein